MGTLSSETQAGRSPPRRTCPASQSFLVTFRSPHRRVITSLPVPVSTSCYLPRKGALGAEHFAGWRLWSKRLIPISTYWVPVKVSSNWRLLSLKKKKFCFFFFFQNLYFVSPKSVLLFLGAHCMVLSPLLPQSCHMTWSSLVMTILSCPCPSCHLEPVFCGRFLRPLPLPLCTHRSPLSSGGPLSVG